MSGKHYEWKVGESLPMLGEHSAAKHTIFDQYVEIYIERLTRTPSQTMLNLTIVGGFSGGGLYRHGTNEADGSPLRKLHWRLTNRFRHHGGAGFHALGFDPSQDLRQSLMTFMFDDDAMKRSEAAVLEQLPKMIHAANRDGSGLLVEALFAGNCNDTPVTSDIMAGQLLLLRDEGELYIMGKDGSPKPRSRSVTWEDRLVLPRERSLFSRLGS